MQDGEIGHFYQFYLRFVAFPPADEEGIENAAKDGEFLSKEDFRDRCKCGKTITDLLSELGILKDLPETNQLSLFDFVSGTEEG